MLQRAANVSIWQVIFTAFFFVEMLLRINQLKWVSWWKASSLKICIVRDSCTNSIQGTTITLDEILEKELEPRISWNDNLSIAILRNQTIEWRDISVPLSYVCGWVSQPPGCHQKNLASWNPWTVGSHCKGKSPCHVASWEPKVPPPKGPHPPQEIADPNSRPEKKGNQLF